MGLGPFGASIYAAAAIVVLTALNMLGTWQGKMDPELSDSLIAVGPARRCRVVSRDGRRAPPRLKPLVALWRSARAMILVSADVRRLERSGLYVWARSGTCAATWSVRCCSGSASSP